MFTLEIKHGPLFHRGELNTSKRTLALGMALALLGGSGQGWAEAQRDYITIVGSSTVYPFARAVAEQFGKTGKFKTPKVESGGTGSGIKKFCGGVGTPYPDIANASRPMKKSESEYCNKFDVQDLLEVKIGYDGIVLATAPRNKPLKLTRKELFLALAKDVPDPDFPSWDKLVRNPYKTWNEINPALPNAAIKIWGPPKSYGTRDAFAEMALEGGCLAFDWIKVLKSRDEEEFKNLCQTIRQDGVYVETADDSLILRKLNGDTAGIGIFRYGFVAQNADKISPIFVDGVEPKYKSIYNLAYPVSRPLYFYVKKAHIGLVPGIREYIGEFLSERAAGSRGYLAAKGLIPLLDEERQDQAEKLLSD